MVAHRLDDLVCIQVSQIHQCLEGGHPVGLHLAGGLLNLELVQ